VQSRIICRLLPNLQVEVLAEASRAEEVQQEERQRSALPESSLRDIGTCTVMTVAALAAGAGISLESLVVEIEAKPEAGTGGKPSRVLRIVRVSGPLEEGDIEKIREWAGRCTLAGELQADIALETEVAYVRRKDENVI